MNRQRQAPKAHIFKRFANILEEREKLSRDYVTRICTKQIKRMTALYNQVCVSNRAYDRCFPAIPFLQRWQLQA